MLRMQSAVNAKIVLLAGECCGISKRYATTEGANFHKRSGSCTAGLNIAAYACNMPSGEWLD
jgi:hypothetical protein